MPPTDDSEARDTRPVAAVFDLDRTVTVRGTYTRFLVSVARAEPLLFRHAPAMVLASLAYRAGLIERARLKEHMLAPLFAGRDPASERDHADAFVSEWTRHRLRPGAVEKIAEHRAAGDRLILATASLDFYADRFADALGFDEVVATLTERDGAGSLTGLLASANCYGEEKLRRLRDAFPELEADYRVVAYSDHVTDLPLLTWADAGVVVNPAPGFATIAAGKGLPVVDWGTI